MIAVREVRMESIVEDFEEGEKKPERRKTEYQRD